MKFFWNAFYIFGIMFVSILMFFANRQDAYSPRQYLTSWDSPQPQTLRVWNSPQPQMSQGWNSPPLQSSQNGYSPPPQISQGWNSPPPQISQGWNSPPPQISQSGYLGQPQIPQGGYLAQPQIPQGGYSQQPQISQGWISPPSPQAMPSVSSGDPHEYCKKYITQVAKFTGIMPKILLSIAKAESGRGKEGPWPWTVNVAGKSYYFENRPAANAFLMTLSPKKKYHVDVGCMQLNWGYQGDHFPYLIKMLNPRLNILMGALFLKELYNEKHSWAKAVAAYHSRNWNKHGGAYANRVAHYVKSEKRQG